MNTKNITVVNIYEKDKHISTKSFKCPKCKGRQVEEVVENVTTFSTVDVISNRDNDIYLDSIQMIRETSDGDIPYFRCSNCCDIVMNKEDTNFSSVIGYEALYDWIMENGIDLSE